MGEPNPAHSHRAEYSDSLFESSPCRGNNHAAALEVLEGGELHKHERRLSEGSLIEDTALRPSQKAKAKGQEC